MPFGNVSHHEIAYQIVDGAEEFDSELLIDCRHMRRTGIPIPEVAKVPRQLLVSVELDDGDVDVKGTLLEDAIHRRRFCGEASFDFSHFIKTFQEIGFDSFYSIEVMSHELCALVSARRRALRL
ncbi:hypothetical protein [Shimia sp.]|uniref:hypothetical protein n=1 Tax=Shimia sp. TaxID=1954381 RepID=UPI00329A36D3